MTIEQEIAALTTQTTALLTAVNVGKEELDDAVAASQAAAQAAQAAASGGGTNVTAAPSTSAPANGFKFIINDVGTAKQLSLADLATLLAPYFEGAVPLDPGALDSTTFAAYRAAIDAASTGSKRLAGANAIITAFQPAHRLRIFRDASVIIDAAYSGNLVATNDGTNVVISLGTLTGATVATGDIDTGAWTFEVQGGSGFARKISGTVGKSGSGADFILTDDTAPGNGIKPTVSFIVPRSIDGL